MTTSQIPISNNPTSLELFDAERHYQCPDRKQLDAFLSAALQALHERVQALEGSFISHLTPEAHDMLEPLEGEFRILEEHELCPHPTGESATGSASVSPVLPSEALLPIRPVDPNPPELRIRGKKGRAK